MSEPLHEPLTVELAPLPREQIGPFLVLGVEKDASPDRIQAHWAQRAMQARNNQGPASLADINWARDVLNDPDQRLQADASSLNIDTTDRLVRRLAEQFGLEESKGPRWEPLENERLTDTAIAVTIPEPETIRAHIVVREVSAAAPAAATLLEQRLREPLDPWAIELSAAESHETLARPVRAGV